jgi:hypothetical protein
MFSSTSLLPFQPATMSSAQLAAVSFLARYSGTPTSCTPTSCGNGSPGVRATGSTRWSGSSAPMSSSTSAGSATAA